jgi:Putative DNA-binding domain
MLVRHMTTWQSLLYCPAADVTLDRIRNLIAVTGTEPLTVDFKQGGNTPAIAECAAAMANMHGGLIFVGITDQEREIVGVPREAVAHVADVLATHLESPDWQPEMIEVALGDDKPDRYVLVLRINRDAAPRPVFVEVTAKFSKERRSIFWAPVRMPGSIRQATRDGLYALFTERKPAETPDAQWDLNRPDIPQARDGGTDPTVDFVVLSGLHVRAAPAAWGRPISERAVEELALRLDRSALSMFLLELTWRSNAFATSFSKEGINRSHIANLVWRLLPGEPVPFEMTAHVEVPGHYGLAHVGELVLTLKLVSRLTAWLNAGRSSEPPPPGPRRRLEVSEWAALLGSVAATLASPDVIGPVADLAGVDPITVRQPRVLHLVSAPPMPELLPAQLVSIRDTGVSYGAHMLADPALDLDDPADRDEQVDRWLNQIGADAGLRGMEQLVVQMRGLASS